MIFDQNNLTPPLPGVIGFPGWVYGQQAINPPATTEYLPAGNTANQLNLIGTIGRFIQMPLQPARSGV